MSYFGIMKEHLLSQQNVDHLLDKVFSTFKISPNSAPTCAKVIRDLLTSYLPAINNPPNTENDMLSGIGHLNALCFDQFEEYLKQKFPGRDLRLSSEAHRSPVQTQLATQVKTQPLDRGLDEMTTKTSSRPMQIIDRSQVKQLLRENNMLKNSISTEFLRHMADPEVLTMFLTMVNKVNAYKPAEDTKNFTKIIDAKQLQELLKSPATRSSGESSPAKLEKIKKHKKSRKAVEQSVKKTPKKPIRPPTPPESSDSDLSSSESDLSSSDSESDYEEDHDIYFPPTKKYDVRNINSKNLAEIHARIKELSRLRGIYLAREDRETVKTINDEKSELLKVVIALKEQAASQLSSSQAKIDSINKSDDDSDSEIIDLKIDPMDNKENLLNMIYALPPRKIKEITLHDYYLPHNPNNITRFNNRFLAKLDGRVSRVQVPEGFYEIDLLLTHLGGSIGYLEFIINKDKTISIKSKCDAPFDILIDDYSFMDMLGFTESSQTYQGSTIYHGNKPYDISVPKKVIFSTNGTDQGPFTLETDQRIHLKEPLVLRKHNRGISIKNLQIILKTPSGRTYDFIMPLQMCFHVSYSPIN